MSRILKKKGKSNKKENKDKITSEQSSKPLICFQCGEKLQHGDEFCFSCGEVTEDEISAHHDTEGGLQAIKKFKNREFK